MDNHQSSDAPEGQEGLEPTTDAPKASTDPKTVPLGEHIELRQTKSALEKELAELKARLAKVEKPAAEPSKPNEELGQRLAQIERRDRLRDLKVEHDLSTKQAEAVLDLVDKMPGLNLEEAKILAATRSPDIFKAEDRADGYNPAIHGAGRPTPGSRPAVDSAPDTPQRLDTIKKLMKVNKGQAKNLLNNLIGNMAAQQVGKPGHQRLPIPKLPQ